MRFELFSKKVVLDFELYALYLFIHFQAIHQPFMIT